MADIVVKPPEEFSKDDLRAIEALVRQGGEVESRNLSDNLRKALQLGAVFDQGRVVGVGAIKWPGAHRDTIVRRSGFTDLNSFSAEIGYFYVHPSCRARGFAGKLFKSLLSEYPCALYATTREDNEPVQRILKKNGFTRAGQPWDSTQSPGKKIHLWVGPRRDCPPE
jgi:ribosomal protein S18 acetylase RimI-like enzyme